MYFPFYNIIVLNLNNSGAYGEVKLAFEKESCDKCAIKIIKKNKFTIHGRNQMVKIYINIKYNFIMTKLKQNEIYLELELANNGRS